MPKIADEMTALAVRRLNGPGFHAVGGVQGLHLRISRSGARSWILRATVGSKRRDIGLGSFPTVTLSQARESAREARDAIRRGIDPVEDRRAKRMALAVARARDVSFAEAMDRFLQYKVAEFKNVKHAAQWRSTLERYALPSLGRLRVSEIELVHIVRVLEPIWQEKTETASRLRGRMEAVLNWATVSGFREGENPARWRGNLDSVLPRPSKIAGKVHHRALPIDALPGFFADLRRRDGVGARALEFLILTAARSGEVRGAEWDEIDIDQRLWTIPSSRMKAGREHRVPLSPPAIDILRTLPDSGRVVFQAPRGGRLSDMSISAVTRRMGVGVVPHGFRSTFRDWASERTDFPHEMAEMALAHTITNSSEAAYRRGDLLEKRRAMMDAWATYCESGNG